MKPGDVVILKKGLAYNRVGSTFGEYLSEDDKPLLTLIEGKADIGGCVLAKDAEGKVRCINPALFDVKWTREEVVAMKMMDDPRIRPPQTFVPVSPPVPTGFTQAIHDVMARAVAESFDDEIINGRSSK